jgi:hypothetical protein
LAFTVDITPVNLPRIDAKTREISVRSASADWALMFGKSALMNENLWRRYSIDAYELMGGSGVKSSRVMAGQAVGQASLRFLKIPRATPNQGRPSPAVWVRTEVVALLAKPIAQLLLSWNKGRRALGFRRFDSGHPAFCN